MRSLGPDQYESLVTAIYNASLDPGLWPDFIALLDAVLDNVYVCMFGHDQSEGVSFGMLYSKFPDTLMTRYQTEYAASNPFAPSMLNATANEMKPFESWLDSETFHRTDFYNDLLRPQEDIGTGAMGAIFNDSDRLLVLGGNIRMMDRDTTTDRLTEILTLLAPHVRNAFDIQRRLQNSAHQATASAQLIEAAGRPVFVLSRSGRALQFNSAAEALLRAGAPLRVDRHGVLTAGNPDAARTLASGLSEMTSHDPTRNRTRRFVVQDMHGNRHLAILSPFAPGTLMNDGGLSGFLIGGNDPVALLTLGPDTGPAMPFEERLARRFTLTRAEADLTAALARGTSLATIAGQRSRSIHTLRNQLKSVFSKTQTHSQGELIVLTSKI